MDSLCQTKFVLNLVFGFHSFMVTHDPLILLLGGFISTYLPT